MNEEYRDDEINLSDLLRFFGKHIMLIIAVTVIFAICGAALSFTKKPTYTSKSSMTTLRKTGTNVSAEYNISEKNAVTVAGLVKQNMVLDKVSAKTGTPANNIASGLSATVNGCIINFTYTDSDQGRAKTILDEVMNAVLEITSSEGEDQVKYWILKDGVSIISNASEPAKSESGLIKNTVVAAAAGIALSLLAVLILFLTYKKYLNANEAERNLGIPVLAEIKGEDINLYNAVKVKLSLGSENKNRVFAFCPASKADENEKNILNTAKTFADSGKKVIAFACKEGKLSSIFNSEKEDCLAGYADDLNKLIADLKNKYDYIFTDTASLNDSLDLCMVASLCDGAIINISKEKTEKKKAAETVNILRQCNINISGCIFNTDK